MKNVFTLDTLENSLRPLAIYAHPDDEIIGCSSAIRQLRYRIHVAYATDGMPSPDDDSSYYAPHTRYEFGDSYRSMRKDEARNALSVLGMEDSSRAHFLDFPDSRLHEQVGRLIASISEMVRQISPDLIITAAYEGGHIDHDILTAAIWHCTQGQDLTICETPLYSLDSTGRITHNTPTQRHIYSDEQRVVSPQISNAKRLAFAAYNSQRDDLQHFNPLAAELYYFAHCGDSSQSDFSTPPNDGRLLYAQKPGSVQFSDFQAALASSISSFVKP